MMRAHIRSPGWLLMLMAAAPSLLLIADLRHFIESRMLLHMMVEFPLLLAAGGAASKLLLPEHSAIRRLLATIDYRGLTAITLLLCVSTYWMIPASLDHALLDPGVATVKYLSWWTAGMLLALGWQRISDVLVVFLLGNLSWMFGSVGLLYQTSESRLCVNYLFGDQQATGRALVALAIAVALLLAVRVYRSSRLRDRVT